MTKDEISIVTINGNPSDSEIAAISSAITVYFAGISSDNPQNMNDIVHKSVDNLQGHVGIARAKSRNSNEIMGQRTTHSWTFIHRIHSRK